MELLSIGSFRIETERVRPYRLHVKVVEFDSNGLPTGRSWTERFDTNQNDQLELANRFAKRILSGDPPPDKERVTPETDILGSIEKVVADAVGAQAQKAIEEIIPQVGTIAYSVAEEAAHTAAEEAADARTWRNRIKKAVRRKRS